MTSNTLLVPSDIAIQQPAHDFDVLIDLTLKTVAKTSQRVYHQTYRLWKNWCFESDIDPLQLTFANVAAFLESRSVSQTTRQRQLSAIRKLAEMFSILDFTNPVREAAYKSLMKLKVRHMGTNGKARDRHALTPAQADKVLRMWNGTTKLDQRNRAIVAVLFLVGLRRSEAAALQWADVNIDDGVIHVQHGKGDVERDVSIAGDLAIEALIRWHEEMGEDRIFVFPSLLKGDKIGADEPTDSQTIYRVIKTTEAQTGIKFTPHTARRTFITEALANGAPLADVQAQAGHKQESTTLRYARPVDARNRRSRLRLRYG